MAERPYKHPDFPDITKLKDTRSAEEIKLQHDCMGYDLYPYLSQWTVAERQAARAMAALEGFEWDVVTVDPRVTGRRYLERARVALHEAAKVAPHDRA